MESITGTKNCLLIRPISSYLISKNVSYYAQFCATSKWKPFYFRWWLKEKLQEKKWATLCFCALFVYEYADFFQQNFYRIIKLVLKFFIDSKETLNHHKLQLSRFFLRISWTKIPFPPKWSSFWFFWHQFCLGAHKLSKKSFDTNRHSFWGSVRRKKNNFLFKTFQKRIKTSFLAFFQNLFTA